MALLCSQCCGVLLQGKTSHPSGLKAWCSLTPYLVWPHLLHVFLLTASQPPCCFLDGPGSCLSQDLWMDYSIFQNILSYSLEFHILFCRSLTQMSLQCRPPFQMLYFPPFLYYQPAFMLYLLLFIFFLPWNLRHILVQQEFCLFCSLLKLNTLKNAWHIVGIQKMFIY